MYGAIPWLARPRRGAWFGQSGGVLRDPRSAAAWDVGSLPMGQTGKQTVHSEIRLGLVPLLSAWVWPALGSLHLGAAALPPPGGGPCCPGNPRDRGISATRPSRGRAGSVRPSARDGALPEGENHLVTKRPAAKGPRAASTSGDRGTTPRTRGVRSEVWWKR